jgi:hypothetical protein
MVSSQHQPLATGITGVPAHIEFAHMRFYGAKVNDTSNGSLSEKGACLVKYIAGRQQSSKHRSAGAMECMTYGGKETTDRRRIRRNSKEKAPHQCEGSCKHNLVLLHHSVKIMLVN